MLNSDAVSGELLRGSSHRVGVGAAATAPPPTSVTASTFEVPGVVARVRRLELSDRQLALVVSAALFVVGAWPIALTDVPPYQDLPNHLATARILGDLGAYPEYVFNGFFKTNAALFTWLSVVGGVTGLPAAARLFALMTVAATALVIPRFVLRLSGSRRRTLTASLFAWPMAHNWFVSMGMLDFALAVPLSLALLMLIDRQRHAPTALRAVGIAALGLATWYAHVFPLLVVHLLVVVEAVAGRSPRPRLAEARRMLLPLLPVTLLAASSVALHVRDSVGPMSGFVHEHKLLAPWELAYNLWAEWFWGFSKLSLSSLVPCVALAVFGVHGLRVHGRRGAPAFFSPWALALLVVLYCFLPYKATNWFHVNSRLVPYIWLALLLFVPERLPKPLVAALGVSALLYTAGMGIDYVRLDRERQEFSAGIEAVPDGAQLLPLLFTHKSTAENTGNLLHMWGYYVVERKTSAPLVFAHSRSFPLTYKDPPPPRFNHLVLETFAPTMASPASACSSTRPHVECDELFRFGWRTFYEAATPRFDHLLLWDPTPEAVAMIPHDYERTFEHGRLSIYARREGATARR